MDIRQWWLSIHPLDYLRLSKKEISPIEQRDFLYRQEMALEKSYRTQQDFNQAFKEYSQIQEAKIVSILEKNRNQYNLSEWIENIWHYLSNVDYWIRDLSSQISLNREVTIQWVQFLAWEIWKLWQLTQNWLNEMISWIRLLSSIVYDVHSELQRINLNISNPEKVLLLERKRDWFEYYKNWWIDESLERLKKALEVIWTDYDIHFLMWIIYLEEFKDYEKAIDSFQKAVRYSKPNNTEIYIASLNKLSLTQYITWDFESAFKNQMEVISNSEKEELDISASYYFDLARYSAITWNKEIFEKAVFECLSRNRSFLIKFLTEKDFIEEWKQKIIKKIINNLEFTPVIKKLFEELLYRSPKKDEYEYYLWKTNNWSNENDIKNEIIENNEYKNLKSKIDSINAVFNDLLERNATEKEIQYYFGYSELNLLIETLKNSNEYKILKKKKDDESERIRIENELKKDKFYCLKITIKNVRENWKDLYNILREEIEIWENIIKNRNSNQEEINKINDTLVKLLENLKWKSLPVLPKARESSSELIKRFSYLAKVVKNKPDWWENIWKNKIELRNNGIYFYEIWKEIELYDSQEITFEEIIESIFEQQKRQKKSWFSNSFDYINYDEYLGNDDFFKDIKIILEKMFLSVNDYKYIDNFICNENLRNFLWFNNFDYFTSEYTFESKYNNWRNKPCRRPDKITVYIPWISNCFKNNWFIHTKYKYRKFK